MDDQLRYSESGDVINSWGGAAGGGGGAAGAGAALAGTKHPLTVNPGTVPPAKTPKSQAYATWVAGDPLKSLGLCASWASKKWGKCEKGASPKCTRAHQYPASVSPADQQAFKAWAVARP